jgi:hypothetical protein
LDEGSQQTEPEVAEGSAGDTASSEGIELTTESETPAAVGETGDQDGEDEGKRSSGSAATSSDE